MYKWMQENRNRILAVFAVGLMIVFILPTTVMHTMGSGEPIVGYLGEEPVRAQAMDLSRSKWQWLSNAAKQMAAREAMFGGAPVVAPPPFRLLLDQGLLGLFDDQPELFFLLVHEARQMGIGVNRDSIDALMGILSATQMVAPPATLQEAEYHRQALQDLLLLNAALDRVTATVKVSNPRVEQQVATQFQQLYLNLVEFRASEFLDGIPDPTAEQINAHIEKFGDVDPSNIDDETNPHGFSYRLPDRLKLQYIEIPIDQVRANVEKSRDEFDWKSQAYRYYQDNLSSFPTTQPADVEQMFEDVNLSLGDAPSTRPTTRPFDEVYEQIKRDLMAPLVDRKLQQIQERVQSLLQRGFERYQAEQSDRPWTGRLPIDAPYDDYAFLQAVAALVQKEHGISLNLMSVENRWLDTEALEALSGIGRAIYQASENWNDWMLFAQYIYDRLEPFHEGHDHQHIDDLRVNQPTVAFTGTTGNIYIARVTAAQTAHAPANEQERQELAARAAADLKQLAAYEKALAAAKALHEQAEGDRLLQSAANKADRRMISVGPVGHAFSEQTGWTTQVPGYDLPADVRPAFVEQSAALLRMVRDDRRHPTRLIELPHAGRVAVAEFDRAQPAQLPERFARFNPQALAHEMAFQQATLPIKVQWLNPDQIRQRTAWQPTN